MLENKDRYPVSYEKCGNCPFCYMVEGTITVGPPSPEEEDTWTFRCRLRKELECELEEEECDDEFEEYDEPSGHGVYGSCNPWDAPGMSLNDFF